MNRMWTITLSVCASAALLGILREVVEDGMYREDIIAVYVAGFLTGFILIANYRESRRQVGPNVKDMGRVSIPSVVAVGALLWLTLRSANLDIWLSLVIGWVLGVVPVLFMSGGSLKPDARPPRQS